MASHDSCGERRVGIYYCRAAGKSATGEINERLMKSQTSAVRSGRQSCPYESSKYVRAIGVKKVYWPYSSHYALNRLWEMSSTRTRSCQDGRFNEASKLPAPRGLVARKRRAPSLKRCRVVSDGDRQRAKRWFCTTFRYAKPQTGVAKSLLVRAFGSPIILKTHA